jgi:hypothetical protein
MKTIIAGSREGFRYLHVANAMSILEDFPTEVVSGGAPGVDTFAIDWATNNGIDLTVMPANWGRYKKAAGYRRNARMAEYADQLIAIWDGQSPGTRNMINIMVKKDKPVWLFNKKDMTLRSVSEAIPE